MRSAGKHRAGAVQPAVQAGPILMPRRVKVQRDLFHGQVPEGAVYVGRGVPGLKQSRWHNPFREKGHGLDEALQLYTVHVAQMADEIRADLAGKDLACWCPLDQLCHADLLLQIANDDPEPILRGSRRPCQQL